MPDADLTKRILKAVVDRFDDEVAFTAELTRVPSLRGREAPAQDDGAGDARLRAVGGPLENRYR
jgi:acetylornithine deacetylase